MGAFLIVVGAVKLRGFFAKVAHKIPKISETYEYTSGEIFGILGDEIREKDRGYRQEKAPASSAVSPFEVPVLSTHQKVEPSTSGTLSGT